MQFQRNLTGTDTTTKLAPVAQAANLASKRGKSGAHDKKFPCTYSIDCTSSFSRSEHLQRHIRQALNRAICSYNLGNIQVKDLMRATAAVPSLDSTTCDSMLRLSIPAKIRPRPTLIQAHRVVAGQASWRSVPTCLLIRLLVLILGPDCDPK